MAVEELIESYPESIQALVREARKMVGVWLPEAQEGEDLSARMFAYRYGPGYRGMICTLILGKTGVKLGIVGGAALPDPHHLLRGAGKVHRHIQLKTSRDLLQSGVKELVLAAAGACNERLA